MEYYSTDLLKANPENPRILSADKFDKLKQSIIDFPEMLEMRPIVIDESNMVLGGNMRLRACIELGLKEIPVIKRIDLTENQKAEFIIKDNVSFGLWDWDILNNEWSDLPLSEWGLDTFSIDTEEPDLDFDRQTKEPKEDPVHVSDTRLLECHFQIAKKGMTPQEFIDWFRMTE
jgi:hypothetical protein